MVDHHKKRELTSKNRGLFGEGAEHVCQVGLIRDSTMIPSGKLRKTMENHLFQWVNQLFRRHFQWQSVSYCTSRGSEKWIQGPLDIPMSIPTSGTTTRTSTWTFPRRHGTSLVP